MKVLFASYRHTPLERAGETGADYQFFNALKANSMDVRVAGPFVEPPALPERIARRLYQHISKRRYFKYDLSNSLRASRMVNQIACQWKPDLIFSLYPAPLVFCRSDIPCVFRTDATFLGMACQGEEFLGYGSLAMRMNIWMERKVIQKCSLILTHSDWARRSLLDNYQVSHEKIALFPNPASLPEHCIPEKLDFRANKPLNGIVQLLFIGRDMHRKGLDIALDTVGELNRSGVAANLTVCGLNGDDGEHITYVGNLDKSDDSQFTHYFTLLKKSHLLIHPARFDPSPRVTSEAAAFGTPVITNDVGGLATSVKNGESGIVLPRRSPPEAYVQAIQRLVRRPEAYYALCESSRKRYERELSSEMAGKNLARILQNVIEPSHCFGTH